jgi:predicted ABC-type ATPase
VGSTDTPDLADQDKVVAGAGETSLERRLSLLPDGHPAEEGAADRGRRLTDAEHAEHVAEVREKLADTRAAGLATDFQHTIDVKREIWSDERAALHDALLDELYQAAANVPCERKAVIAGGIAGAGKTTVLTQHAGIDLTRYLMINPDLVKEEMAKRGLVPEVDGLTPMEASELVHEESSYIAKRLAQRAQADGRNVIWDVTMAKSSSASERIDWLRDAGYTRIEAIFVDIPVEVSIRRTDGRHRQGHEDYRDGRGLGGRYIPPEMITAQADAQWGTRNRANFEQLKHRFDAWSCYDNSVDGRDPVLTESSRRQGDQ